MQQILKKKVDAFGTDFFFYASQNQEYNTIPPGRALRMMIPPCLGILPGLKPLTITHLVTFSWL
jgi:hypothetical protein